MWSSVWMCAGMAGESSLGKTESWTLRSKISDEATADGGCGDEKPNGGRVGEAATKRLGGEGDEEMGFMFAAGVEVALLLLLLISASLSFFLPRPNNRRLEGLVASV